MAERAKAPKLRVVCPESVPVVTVLDHFLDWCEKHKAARTFAWYRDYLQSFVGTIDAAFNVDDLKPFHVQEWVDRQPGWKTGKRGAIIAAQRALNWAAKLGRIPANPLGHREKPPQGRREQLITPEEFDAVPLQVKDDAFADLLQLSWETGPGRTSSSPSRPGTLTCRTPAGSSR